MCSGIRHEISYCGIQEYYQIWENKSKWWLQVFPWKNYLWCNGYMLFLIFGSVQCVLVTNKLFKGFWVLPARRSPFQILVPQRGDKAFRSPTSLPGVHPHLEHLTDQRESITAHTGPDGSVPPPGERDRGTLHTSVGRQQSTRAKDVSAQTHKT